MPLPKFIEGRQASLADAIIENGSITISDSVPIRTTAGEPVTIAATGIQTSISDNVQVTITTLTANGINRLTMISCSGSGYAKFQMYLNSTLVDTKRSSPERNVVFVFYNPVFLNPGDVVDIKVTHYNVGVLEDFEATIYGYSYNP